ncbi:MAG: tetratricopeptide repeat protein [Alphaproteobacteria bacterium]
MTKVPYLARLVATIAVIVVAGLAAPRARADVVAGLRAYQDGDYATAYAEFSAAADQPEAQYNLGLLYYFGLGTEQNFAAAREAFTSAALADFGDAQFMLGAMHERGEGAAPSLALAQLWYELAAATGHVEAQYRAGVLGAHADPVADQVRGLVWVMLASAHGHPDAQANIAALTQGLTAEDVATVSEVVAVLEARQGAATVP